jgi:hypothetical protein
MRAENVGMRTVRRERAEPCNIYCLVAVRPSWRAFRWNACRLAIGSDAGHLVTAHCPGKVVVDDGKFTRTATDPEAE